LQRDRIVGRLMQLFFEKYYNGLSYASSLSILLPLLYGLFFLNKENRLYITLFLYVLLIALIELSGHLTVYFGTSNNLWLSHLYTPIEFFLLTSAYYISLKDRNIRKAIIGSVILFLIFSFVDAFYGEGIRQMNSYTKVLEGSLLIALVLVYFYVIFRNLNKLYLDQDPMFVLNCGILIYFAGTTMAYLMFNRALAISDNMARICLSITYVLNIIFNVVLLVVLKRASRI
jgi:hypothetical protein